jgi:signal transduction histidine kinase
MIDMLSRFNFSQIANFPAFVGYLGVAVAGIMDLDDPNKRWIALGLLIVFGIAFFLPDKQCQNHWQYFLRMGIETVTTTGLMILQPGWSVFPILFFLMSPQAILWFDLRPTVFWLAGFTVITAVIFCFTRGWGGLILMLPYVAGYIFFANFGWLLAQSEKERRRNKQLLLDLQEANRKLQEYADQIEELAIVQERNRIAREMHDSLGHRLTISAIQLEGAQRLIKTDPDRTDRIIGTVREQIHDGLTDLRRTLAMLRASIAEDLPLTQALTKLAVQMEEATSLHIHMELGDTTDSLPAAIRQALFRTAQEGLTNIQRHSQATDAWIQLWGDESRITLMISDNGIGFTDDHLSQPAHFGLSGLKERASILNGQFTINPRPGGGTQISISLPITEEKTS